MEKKKGLKRFKGFNGLEPFKVCTLRERISHVLSKKLSRATQRVTLKPGIQNPESQVIVLPIQRVKTILNIHKS